MSIRMPPRNSIVETIATAASRCIFLACQRYFESIPLGNVVDIVSGGTPSTDNAYYWDGEIVWITPKDLGRPRNIEIEDSDRKITDVGLANSSSRLLPIGTVLLSSRAPIGHLGISAVPLATNQGFKNLICSEAISNRYLFHMLRANIEQLQSLGRGNTFLEIPAKIVKDFFIPLPPLVMQHRVADFLDSFYVRLSGNRVELPELPDPIADQRRIVAHIEALAARIAEARGLRQGALEEAAGLLGSAVVGSFSDLSSRFGDYRLGDFITDIRYGTSQKTHDDARGTPIFRMGNIQDGILLFDNFKYLFMSDNERESLLLQSGDILVNRTNSAELVGKCGVFEAEGDYSFASYIIRVRLDPKRALPRLVAYYINSPIGREYMFRERKQMTGQANINSAKLKALPLPLPEPHRQIELLTYFDSLRSQVDELKLLQAETAAELDALLPSLLDRAFKGEL